MKAALRDLMDRVLNWSGGAYVGLATLTVVALAIAQYAAGEPLVVVLPNGQAHIYIVHRAPEWFVSELGVYTIILGLFAVGRPINSLISRSKTPPPILGGPATDAPAAT